MAPAATATGKWIADDPDLIPFLLANSPPRPGSYGRQLAIDIRSPRLWLPIFQGGLFLLLGLSGAWQPLTGCAIIIVVYAYMLWRVARGLREGRLLVGEVRIVRPFDDRMARAEATLAGGDTVWITLPIEPATSLIVRHGFVEVLILSSPSGGTCTGTGVGVRVPADSDQAGVIHGVEK
jgi:hypothetical protein